MMQRTAEAYPVCPHCGLPRGDGTPGYCSCPEVEVWECRDCELRCSVRIPRALGLAFVGDLLHLPDAEPPFTCWNPVEVDPND